MANISKQVMRVLESFCGATMGELLSEKRQEDFEALQAFLSMDPTVKPLHRQAAIYLLGRWGDAAPVATISKLLPQLDESGRITAIDALGRLGTPEAFNTIIQYSNDPSPDVRRFVVTALGRTNTSKSKTKLQEIERNDPLDFIRSRASKILKSRANRP